MDNHQLLTSLDHYLNRHPEEQANVIFMRTFANDHPDCFYRSCLRGHFTGSAWIYDPRVNRALLIHHRKLDRWLQPGGHADGDEDLARVAKREAQEETGLVNLRFYSELDPLDLDIHTIPTLKDVPEHIHLDVRYLFIADSSEQLSNSPESNEVRWFNVDELISGDTEPSIVRMALKSCALLNSKC